MPTPAEVFLIIYLLPDLSMSTKVDDLHVTTECNNRIIQAFIAAKPLDAYPDNGRELGKFGDSYVSKVRERDSLMLCFLQALTPSPPDPPSVCFLSLHPTPDDPRAFKNQQPAVSPWPTSAIQHTTAATQISTVPQPVAAVPGATQIAFAASHPQLAPMFQSAAAPAGGAASTKQVRDATAGKVSCSKAQAVDERVSK